MSQYNIPRRPIGWEDDDAMFDHWEKAMDMAFDKPQQRKEKKHQGVGRVNNI